MENYIYKEDFTMEDMNASDALWRSSFMTISAKPWTG